MKRFQFLRLRVHAWIAALLLAVVSASYAEAQYYGGGPSICVTSRGNCSAGNAPMGAGCYCNIPGFGRKAGNVRGVAGAPRVRRDAYEEGYEYRPRPRRERYADDYNYRPRQRYEDGYAPPRRRVALGSVCVTSRGNCSAGGMYPIMSGCYCSIPGFGRKAGNVRY